MLKNESHTDLISILLNDNIIEWDEIDEAVEVLTVEQFEKLSEYKKENIENGNN